MHRLHSELLSIIQALSEAGTQHTPSETYFGNARYRYAISVPELRKIAQQWMLENKSGGGDEFVALLDSLIRGSSSTEKWMVGFLLDYYKGDPGIVRPEVFNSWLDHVAGWAEVDILCTGKFCKKAIPAHYDAWRPMIRSLVKSDNVNKRRASLVIYCSPLSSAPNPKLAKDALIHVGALRHEKDILITKAISWVLRTMIKHHRDLVVSYLEEHKDSLPSVAVRETSTKLRTGTKTGRG